MNLNIVWKTILSRLSDWPRRFASRREALLKLLGSIAIFCRFWNFAYLRIPDVGITTLFLIIHGCSGVELSVCSTKCGWGRSQRHLSAAESKPTQEIPIQLLRMIWLLPPSPPIIRNNSTNNFIKKDSNLIGSNKSDWGPFTFDLQQWESRLGTVTASISWAMWQLIENQPTEIGDAMNMIIYAN